MFFMAGSPQRTVELETLAGSATHVSIRGKVGRALRRRPYPATACSRAGSVAFHSVSTASTGLVIDAIGRGYRVTVQRYWLNQRRSNSEWA